MKRRSQKPSKRQKGRGQAVRSKAKGNKRPPLKFGRLPKLVMAASVFAFVGLLSYYFLFPAASLGMLPNPDLHSMEEPVARKIKVLHKKVQKNPDSSTAWGELGMNLHIHGLRHEAVACYKRAAELAPGDLRWPYYCGIVLHETGSPEELLWFEKSQSLALDYGPAHIQYGRSLFDAGRWKEAAEAFRRAAADKANASHAHLGLAQVFQAEGDLEASRQSLLQALKADPKHREVHSLLAASYRRLNEPQKALRQLKYAEKLPEVTPLLDPLYSRLMRQGASSYWSQLRGRTYLKKGLYEQSIREFQMVTRSKPSAEAYYDLGIALQLWGKHRKAVGHLQTAVRLDPNYIDALNGLAISLAEVGRTQEALAYVERTIRLNPTDPRIYLNFAMIYLRYGYQDEAARALRHGLNHKPDDLHLSSRLAWLLATSSEISVRDGHEALTLAGTLCEKTNYRVPETLDILAAAYAETGQFKRATEMALRAHQLAVRSKREDLATKIQSRLRLYELKQPFRDKGVDENG